MFPSARYRKLVDGVWVESSMPTCVKDELVRVCDSKRESDEGLVVEVGGATMVFEKEVGDGSEG